MKKVLIGLLFLFASLFVQAQTYYYSGGTQIQLLLDETQIVVRLADINTSQVTQQRILDISNSLNINGLQVNGGGNAHYQQFNSKNFYFIATKFTEKFIF